MVALGAASAMPSNTPDSTALTSNDPTLDPATTAGFEAERADLADRTSRSGRSAALPTGKRQAPRNVWVLPVKQYELTSSYGPRWGTNHNGIDLAGPVGTPIYAAHEGTVIRAGWWGGYGYVVEIDHGNGYTTRYGHNSQVTVSVGQWVSAGTLIAKMGSTGYSTGPHSHFEVRIGDSPIDPISFMRKQGVDIPRHIDSIYMRRA